MKHLILFCLCLAVLKSQSQTHRLQGIVRSQETDEPLIGVNVLIKGTASGTVTNTDGSFKLSCSATDTLVISSIGYSRKEIPVAFREHIDVRLESDLRQLDMIEVYATGYQQVPPERATGSFVGIDQQLLQRSTSPDIISRLESVTPSLLFDKRRADDAAGMNSRSLRIRGVSSIESGSRPLIVVNQFPYDGPLENINPNDVESITVLRDAAAASIWGARAANGVIVITLKEGEFEQPLEVQVTTNVTVGERPNLHHAPNFIPAADYIGLERELFDRGYYSPYETVAPYLSLTPVVEALIQERDGDMTTSELEAELARLATYDVRDQVEKYFYQPSIHQQYAVNLRGGGKASSHYFSAGYDKEQSNIQGNESQRVTLVSNNSFEPIDDLKISADINVTNQLKKQNGFRWGSIGTDLSYNRFADDQGNHLPVTNELRFAYIDELIEQGYLDGYYRPLQEQALNNIGTDISEYRINTGISYRFWNQLELMVKYQHQQVQTDFQNQQDEDSYLVRYQVNRFTQEDGTRIFPQGDILTRHHSQQVAHSGRAQLNYQNTFSQKHSITALVGMEARQVHTQRFGNEIYGYNDDILTATNMLDYTTRYPTIPRSSATLPVPANFLDDRMDRYFSSFANASYTYKNRYTLSGSARYDASNLFGVKTNQKGVPLWSVGASWELSDESFFQTAWLPYLRLRSTYGYNGNIDKSLTAFATASYSTDRLTGLPRLWVNSPGDPQLRWEKIGMVNIGLDFELWDRISGSFEWYDKQGKDMIGDVPVDPTTGTYFNVNRINYAQTQTRGIDLQIHTVNVDQEFQWNTDVFLSMTRNKILDFYNESIDNNSIRSGISSNSSVLPQEGKPIDALYSIPWWGLDPETGDPLVEMEGELVKEYRDYARGLTYDDLVDNGVSVAPIFGAVRNNFSWKGLGLSINVSWKAGYHYRKSGLSYENLIEDREMHNDYVRRWQQPGDEQFTQVPSMPEEVDDYRDFVYQSSEILVEPGDHIRLEDVNLSYSWRPRKEVNPFFQNVRVFGYARNLGILWRAADSSLNPDSPDATYLVPRSYAIGISTTF